MGRISILLNARPVTCTPQIQTAGPPEGSETGTRTVFRDICCYVNSIIMEGGFGLTGLSEGGAIRIYRSEGQQMIN